MPAKLYYDANCPLCSQYARMIRSKVSATELLILPLDSESNDFKFTDVNGVDYIGMDGIDALGRRFPDVLSYLFMIPSSMRIKAAKALYAASGTVRNIISAGGCNCKKKRL